MLGGGGGRIKGGRVLDYRGQAEPPDVPPVPVDDGQDERAAAELRRRLASARRSLIEAESRYDVWTMRLAAFAFLTTSLFAASYQVTPDIEYSAPGGESLKLDAHIPEGKGPFPAIILVHGGGWTAGHKTVNFVQALFPVLDQTGMAWFTIDYRLAPKHPYPAARVDVESAVQWVKANAKQYKVDPNKIALMGESAGGHLVNLVGVKNDVGVAAVVCFYGPIDMEDLLEEV